MNAPAVQSLDHLVLTVADIDTTIRFYTALGMQAEAFTVADGSTRTALTFGAQKINLHPLPGFEPKAQKATPGSADLCFLSDTPLTDWQEHLDSQGLTVIAGPIPRTGATGSILSIYLRDPDGNLIEIANPA